MSIFQLPTEHVHLATKLSPDVARQRLIRQIEPPGLINPITPSRYLFTGELRDFHFHLSQISGFGKRGSGNTIIGDIQMTDTGTVIDIRIQPLITEYYLGFAYLIVPVAISLLCLYWTSTGELPASCGFFPITIFGLGFLLLQYIGGSQSEIQLIGQFREIFEAEVLEPKPSAAKSET